MHKNLFSYTLKQKVWHCGQENTEFTRQTVHEFNWERGFTTINTNEKVSVFNKAILNIVLNFILHETVICDNRDPPWLNTKTKNLICSKKLLYKKYLLSSKIQKYSEHLNYYQIELLH